MEKETQAPARLRAKICRPTEVYCSQKHDSGEDPCPNPRTYKLICTLCFGLGYVTLALVFEFPTGLVNRLAFALQASVFVLLWVLVGVVMVSTGRRKSLEDVGGAASGPPSEKVALQT